MILYKKKSVYICIHMYTYVCVYTIHMHTERNGFNDARWGYFKTYRVYSAILLSTFTFLRSMRPRHAATLCNGREEFVLSQDEQIIF